LLTRALKAYARGLGLDLVGVASAEPFDAERALLEERQASGLGPNPFEVADIQPRVEPERLLPGTRAIVAAGLSYLMPDEPAPESGSPRGWLSRYCRGLDYHEVLGERLEQVAAWLEAAVPGSRTFVHVDTAAPLDRAVAERAGLGRLGKSTNLIAPPFGTWVFLGEVYTTIPLVPDEPATRQVCGSCTRCLDA
jgi:epoxyqueuosine reductase